MPGEGSIFQRKDGRWMAQLSVGGRLSRSYRTRTVATHRAARAALAELRAEAERSVSTTKTSLGDYLVRWVNDVRNIRPATRKAYRDAIDYHLVPVLGGVTLRDLRPAHVERLLQKLPERGLSPKSQRNVYGVLRRALNDAVRKELLTRNPASADFVDAPRVPAKEPRALSVDEVRRLLDVLQGDALEPLVIVAITSGLRQGELLGLAWEDISDAGLRVRYELVRRNGRYHREEPKTPRSRRAVPLPPRAIAALKEHRDRLIAAGFTPIATGPVFCTAKGDPLNGTSVTHRLQKVMARVGITDGDFRMLRRTYASRMFEAGISDRTIADIMGHTQTAVTHGHYIASGAGQPAAVAAAEELVG